MLKRLVVVCVLLGCGLLANAQRYIDKEQVFLKLKDKFSPEAYRDAVQSYEQASDTLKAIMLNVYDLPFTSRREAIANYEEHVEDIEALQTAFFKAVPKDYVVEMMIDIDQDDVLKPVRNVSLMISKKDKTGKLQLVDGEFDLEYDSDRLSELLSILKWDMLTFSDFRYLMQMANCFTITNANPVEIGFKRSGLGKYSYLIFPTDILTVPQIKEYNDGCKYKYYKKNIVIQYEGGMAGPQCFTD